MSGFQRLEEGNYASLEKSLWDTPVNSDLGLTLFPGSQVQTKDEKRSGITAESSSKNAGNRSFGAEIQVKDSIQETAFPNQAKIPRNAPIPGSELANLSYVTADLNQARPFSQGLTVKHDRSAVQHNADSADAALCNGPQIGRSETRKAKSCQHGSYSSRVAKWKKLGIRASYESQGSEPRKVTEPNFETHNDTCYTYYNQGLYEKDAFQSEKGRGSMGIIGLPLSGAGRGSNSRKPELHGQIERSLDVAPERIFPPTFSLASKSAPKHLQYPSLNHSKVLTQQLKYSPLTTDTSAKIRRQFLRCGKRVNKRSWTSFFPAKAKFSQHYNSCDPFFSKAPLTARNCQDQHVINPPLSSVNLQHPSYTHAPVLNKISSDIVSNYSSLFKAFDDLRSLDPLQGILNTAPRRSASMPNLCSMRAPTIMGSSNYFGPALMPTPPSEMENFSLHIQQNHAKSFTTQEMSDSSMPIDRAITTGGSQHHYYPFEVKPNYSYQELSSHLRDQAQSLKAENVNLQSSNTYLKKGVEVLESQKAKMIKHIQYQERTVTEKDQQIRALMQEAISLQKNYKQMRDNYQGLIATLRKENGTGNPSAIAQRIRQGHAPHTTSPGNPGNQPNTNVPPVYLAHRAQMSTSRPEFEQTSSGLQRQMQVQPLSVSGVLEADAGDASIRFLQQQACASANYNRTNLLHKMAFPASSVANPANTSSQASVTPGFVAANHNMNFPRDQSTGCMQPIIPSDPAAGAVTTSHQNDKHPVGHVSPESVTIDLTEESQPPLRSASCNHSVHQTSQSAVQGGDSPFKHLPGQHVPAQYPAINRAQCQSPPGLSAHGQNLKGQVPPTQDSQRPDPEAMRIQSEALARMAKKSLSWLQGANPFRKEIYPLLQSGPSNLEQFSQGNAEGLVISTGSQKEGSVAPLPETATDRRSGNKVPRKARATLTAEAIKERARGYRKKAADKKKREKEVTKQVLQAEAMSTNAMRDQKQQRRANKLGKRQEQSRNPSGGVGPQEPQKTFDGHLYQEDTSVLQAVPKGSIEQAPLDDHDSLFGDDEDSQMEMEDPETSPQADSEILDDGVDYAYAAELEAQLSADADATISTGLEQIDTLGGGDGDVGRPCEDVESEEE